MIEYHLTVGYSKARDIIITQGDGIPAAQLLSDSSKGSLYAATSLVGGFDSCEGVALMTTVMSLVGQSAVCTLRKSHFQLSILGAPDKKAPKKYPVPGITA